MLGKLGMWLHPQFDDSTRTRFAVKAEQWGYGTVWLGLGTASAADLQFVERMLEATQTITIATAIINMWTNDPRAVAESYQRLESRHPGRFVLGVGIGHPESIQTYRKPYEVMVDYFDQLDAGGVPRQRRLLAALGPRALRLAAERSAGTHPYLVPPEHSRYARAVVGPGVLVAPELTAVLGQNRQLARDFVTTPYLGLRNYVSNWRRCGFSEEDVQGSEHLLDELVPRDVAGAVRTHWEAGADHVGVQFLAQPGESPLTGYRELAEGLLATKTVSCQEA